MIDDPIVKEVREARQRILTECGEDLERVLDRYQAAENEVGDCLVTAEEVRERRRVVSPDAGKRPDLG